MKILNLTLGIALLASLLLAGCINAENAATPGNNGDSQNNSQGNLDQQLIPPLPLEEPLENNDNGIPPLPPD